MGSFDLKCESVTCTYIYALFYKPENVSYIANHWGHI